MENYNIRIRTDKVHEHPYIKGHRTVDITIKLFDEEISHVNIPSKDYRVICKTLETLSVLGKSKLATFLAAKRCVYGLSQEEVGKVSGVGQRAVSRLERNPTSARFDVVVKYCEAMGVSLDTFVRLSKSDCSSESN